MFWYKPSWQSMGHLSVHFLLSHPQYIHCYTANGFELSAAGGQACGVTTHGTSQALYVYHPIQAIQLALSHYAGFTAAELGAQ